MLAMVWVPVWVPGQHGEIIYCLAGRKFPQMELFKIKTDKLVQSKGDFTMNPIQNTSGHIPAYEQTSSLNTQSSNGCRLAEEQDLPSHIKSDNNQPATSSQPQQVNISDRSASISTKPATFDYVCPYSDKTYKVVTEQFKHHDGSSGLRLNQENGEEFMQCSLPFSTTDRSRRTYTEPDFDENKQITTLMLIKNYTENIGCLDFLTKNNIVKVVGEAEHGFVDLPIVQLIANEESSNSRTFDSIDSSAARIHAFSGRNFALSLSGYDQLIAQGINTKRVMPDRQVKILEQYINNPELGILENSTFKHIAIFLDSGDRTRRLQIACSDFGYSLSELEQFRRENKSALDVAREVISRTSDDSQLSSSISEEQPTECRLS
ncbi:hypothetical protein [Endozoicomonas sp. SCSIO W0465]|uniref:hypothetical protein n=1 Tax=Endozoicomonas sp. SCSIO W0465 TaxID=2918516 RepID=UPI0020750D17|nr:hypothetical protein [Endozoicomonas sp. SCSIO W0465]USE37887.1 hypothetical protein MJO57_06755 [Endozoicomonas sp. SCSIO W0465]